MLRKLEEQKGFKERSAVAKRFFREGRKDQWRDKLNDAQIRRIVNDHRAQMARFDYIPQGY